MGFLLGFAFGRWRLGCLVFAILSTSGTVMFLLIILYFCLPKKKKNGGVIRRTGIFILGHLPYYLCTKSHSTTEESSR